jgi:predicted ester cyclase
LQQRLAHTNFTAEEKRNILTVLIVMSAEGRAAQAANPTPQPGGVTLRRGFDYLDELYGSHGYDFATSIPDRVDRVEDLIAKGDRVWGVFKVIGHHGGLMFGFPGDNKPVEFREMFFRRFAADGQPLESTYRAEELQIYTGLGGKVSFPKRPATAAGPPPTPAPPQPDVLSATWTTWPPAQWPSPVKNPKLIKVLTETNWTAEEKRNLQTTMEKMVFHRPDPAVYVLPQLTPNGSRRGFQGLYELAGYVGYNQALSVPDRENELEDVIAKGNSVWTVFIGRGHHTGDFMGFPGDGKLIDWREFSYVEFDKEGNRAGGFNRAEELQLYVALGGKTEFPRPAGKPSASLPPN